MHIPQQYHPASTGVSSPCLARAAPSLVLGEAVPGTTSSAEFTFPSVKSSQTQSQLLRGSSHSVWVTADRTMTSRPAKAACFPACDIQPPSHWALQTFFSNGIFIAGAFLLWIVFPCPAALQSINNEYTWVLLKAPTTTTTCFAFLPPRIFFHVLFSKTYTGVNYTFYLPLLCASPATSAWGIQDSQGLCVSLSQIVCSLQIAGTSKRKWNNQLGSFVTTELRTLELL